MDQALDRHELPIQSIKERNEDCTATVPVHLKILQLSPNIRTNTSLLGGAFDTVRHWYNEDMEYYLRCLSKNGYDLPWLKGYETFNDAWSLEAKADAHGFLSLIWGENGHSHSIAFVPVPVVLYNQHDEHRKFYTAESFLKNRLIENIARSIRDEEVVIISPEKMRAYGIENEIAKIDEAHGVARVMGHAFCSDYHDNMAKTLLLRDFAVFYLNELLEVIDKR